MIKLKSFQQEAVEALHDELHHVLNQGGHERSNFAFQAPTGSGKTVMSGVLLDKLFLKHPDLVVFWASIATGALHLQSKKGVERLLPGHINIKLAEDCLTGAQPVLPGQSLVFMSWQQMNERDKKTGDWTNRIMREGERFNFRDVMRETSRHRPTLLIIDESHTNANSARSQELINLLNPNILFEMTATPRHDNFKANPICQEWVSFVSEDKVFKGYRIHPKLVAAEGLICKRLVKNDCDSLKGMTSTSFSLLMSSAYQKHVELKEAFQKHGINPLLLVQVPNKSLGDAYLEDCKAFLKDKGITLQNGKLNIWLEGNKVVSDTLTYTKSDVEVLIFKQAVNTGWDCPRAKVLLQFRDVKSKDTQVQTVGRILRMPEQKHYEDEQLNAAYLYTDLEKLSLSEEIEQLGLLKDAQSRTEIKLTTPLSGYYHGRKTYRGLYVEPLKGFISEGFEAYFKVNPHQSKALNLSRLELAGFDAKKAYYDTIQAGEAEIGDLEHGSWTSLSVKKEAKKTIAATRIFMQRYLAPFGEFDEAYETFMRALLSVWRELLDYSVTLESLCFYLTEHLELFSPLFKDVLETYRAHYEHEANYEEGFTDWNLPPIRLHASLEEEELPSTNSAYVPCYIQVQRPNTEKEFESVVNNNKVVKWWMKNADNGREFLGIGYVFKGQQKTFYPDYLVCLPDGSLWVYETKGYGDANIDKAIEVKAAALEAFIQKHQAKGINIKGAIIAPREHHWYIYETGTNEDYQSPLPWTPYRLFEL